MVDSWESRVPPRVPSTESADREVVVELEQHVVDGALAGDWRVVEEFLDSGGDVNEYYNSGWTLLLYAASYSQAEVVRQLLARGADPNLHHEGYTPLMALSFSSIGDVEESMQCLGYLIQAKADVNAYNKLRETALMLACKMQPTDFVLFLLEHGAHVDFTDSQEWTALFHAVAHNRVETVELLISKGASLTHRSYDGLSALDVAVTKGFDKIIPLVDSHCAVESQIINVRFASHWTDLFPKLSTLKQDEVDMNIDGILCGMGLSSYKKLFCGMDLKRFLKLKEEDLELLGMDLKLHRSKFIDGLVKFHKHEWSSQLVKYNFSENFTSFEAIKLLGNINKQLSVMSSGLHFSKNYLDLTEKTTNSNSTNQLSCVDKEKVKDELKNIKITTLKIKDELVKMQNIVKCINEQNSKMSLPIFIGKKKKKKNNYKWTIISILSVASIYMLSIKRLWNNDILYLKFFK